MKKKLLIILLISTGNTLFSANITVAPEDLTQKCILMQNAVQEALKGQSMQPLLSLEPALKIAGILLYNAKLNYDLALIQSTFINEPVPLKNTIESLLRHCNPPSVQADLIKKFLSRNTLEDIFIGEIKNAEITKAIVKKKDLDLHSQTDMQTIHRVLNLLLDAGAGHNLKKTRHYEPLIMQVANIKVKPNSFSLATLLYFLEVLMKRFPIDVQNEWGNTALFYAACNPSLNVLELLLTAHPNPNILNIKHQNALLFFLKFNYFEPVKTIVVIDLLMRAGTDPNIRDKGGNTPLMLTLLNDEPVELPVILKLIELGSVNAQNNQGRTALMMVVAHTELYNENITEEKEALKICKEIIVALTRAGAALSIKDNQGLTALDYTTKEAMKKFLLLID